MVKFSGGFGMRFKALTLAAAMCAVSVVLAAQGRGGGTTASGNGYRRA